MTETRNMFGERTVTLSPSEWRSLAESIDLGTVIANALAEAARVRYGQGFYEVDSAAIRAAKQRGMA